MQASPAWDPLARPARKLDAHKLSVDALERTSSSIKAFHGENPAWQGSFPTVSGGTVSIVQPAAAAFRVAITRCREDTEQESCLCLQSHGEEMKLSLLSAAGSTTDLACSREPSTSGTGSGMTTHWLSLDLKGNVKYGQGYAMQETVMLAAHLPCSACPWMHQPGRHHISLAAAAAASACGSHQAKLQERLGHQGPVVSFTSCPLGPCNPPPLVCDSANASLLDLDWSACLPSCDLPRPCRELYAVLAQPRIDLDCPRALRGSLSEAIEWSLATPGALLHRTIQSKMGRCFGGANPRQCYVRVSVGHGHGTSPGDPLVMEIWPPGHSSPIHSHASTYGVVRVLHGSITVGVHNKHAQHGDTPLSELEVKRGQMTWFSPQWYQTHALENRGSGFCCTVQGFRYAPEDTVCWPYMEYAGADGEHHDFDPVSDFTFAQLRTLVLEEFAERGSRPSSAASSPSKAVRESPSQPALDLLRMGPRPLERLSPSAMGFLARR